MGKRKIPGRASSAKGDALQKLKTEKKEKAMTRSTGKLQRIGQLNMLFSWTSIV
jgi:hypothetical protein